MSVRGEEGGFTVVEVVVAILVLGLATLATLQIFDASRRNAFRTEQTQVAINRAQRELEQIRQLEYDQVALTSAPGTSSDPTDPRHRVSGSNFALNRDGTNQAELVIGRVNGVGSGSVDPGPTPFSSGDVSGRIYRFVVWQNDDECLSACSPSHDYKRVVVAVKLDDEAISFAQEYDEVQSDFNDPNATALSGGGPGSGSNIITAQQFFLSDTPCSTASGDPTRVDPTDHTTHDTTGTCSNSQKPDAMLTTAPPDPAPDDPADPPLRDYATDIEPATGTDAGLQMLRQDSNGCDPSPGGSDGHDKIHRWVTKKLPIEFVMTGQATLELYTRPINDSNNPGAFCVYMFKRATVLGVDVRTPISLLNISPTIPDPYLFSCTTVGSPAYGRCSTNIWPRNDWQRVRFNFTFPSNTSLLADERLELAISVEKQGTPGASDTMQFMYDHPDMPSRLEVKTTTPLLN
jgi:type II secretory pathway pseudopilin PulG